MTTRRRDILEYIVKVKDVELYIGQKPLPVIAVTVPSLWTADKEKAQRFGSIDAAVYSAADTINKEWPQQQKDPLIEAIPVYIREVYAETGTMISSHIGYERALKEAKSIAQDNEIKKYNDGSMTNAKKGGRIFGGRSTF